MERDCFSSTFMVSDAQKGIWYFSDSLSGSESPPDAKFGQTDKLYPNSGSQHMAMDDIYDATPRKEAASAQEQTTAAPKFKVSKTFGVT
ncbi:hypothetical protein GGI43DRAFT_406235 [Trichoderma evansii]